MLISSSRFYEGTRVTKIATQITTREAKSATRSPKKNSDSTQNSVGQPKLARPIQKEAGISPKRSVAGRLSQLIRKLTGEGDGHGVKRARRRLLELKKHKRLKLVELKIENAKKIGEKTEFKLIRLRRIQDQKKLAACLQTERAKAEEYKASEDARKFRYAADFETPEEAARLRAKADQIMARVETFKSAAKVAESNAKAASSKTKSLELCQTNIESRVSLLEHKFNHVQLIDIDKLLTKPTPAQRCGPDFAPQVLNRDKPRVEVEKQRREFPEEELRRPEKPKSQRKQRPKTTGEKPESLPLPISKLRRRIRRLLRSADQCQEAAIRKFLRARAEVHKKDLAFLAAEGLSKRSGTARGSVDKAFEKFAQQEEVFGIG